MFTLFVIVLEIFAVEMLLILTFSMAKVKCEYTVERTHATSSVGNSNVFPIYHRLQDIQFMNFPVYSIIFDLENAGQG